MSIESFDWLKPSPTWNLSAQDFREPDFFQPALLEFRTDDFMDEFLAVAGAATSEPLDTATLRPVDHAPLKLYQPLHGCYYLVCSSLCCRIPGFPDRQIQNAAGEKVFFVLRKLVNGIEYAWVGNERQRSWEAVQGSARRVAEHEERLPMAATTTGSGRTLVSGYLPVSSSETYKVPAAQLVDQPGDTAPDIRVEEFGARFTGPITGAQGQAAALQATSDQLARTVSVYLLLEGWEYFEIYLPDVAAVLAGEEGAALADERRTEKEALLSTLESISITGSLNMAAALGTVAQARATLNAPGGVEGDTALQALGFGSSYNLKQHTPATSDMLDLIEAVRAALPTDKPPLELPRFAPQATDLYVVRCAYERPQCDPPRLVVSQPSHVFQIAPFFDLEAPARSLNIELPGDISIAAMRRFKKNVSFLMSNAMRRKMDSIAGKEKDLLQEDEPDLSEDGFDLAFICSFSIQIIFIVAFFLLLIFVFILNFVFWWMAFFKICLPIPKSLAPK
jgi:hypothetical protein